MTDRRAFLIVMDSAGIGGAPDAGEYFNDGRPDTGANTLAHCFKFFHISYLTCCKNKLSLF